MVSPIPGFSLSVTQTFKEAKKSTFQKKYSVKNIDFLGCGVFQNLEQSAWKVKLESE